MNYMAAARCARCEGAGELTRNRNVRVGNTDTFMRSVQAKPCLCTLRGIFRECLSRYLRYRRDVSPSVFRLERTPYGYVGGYRSVEYVVDFENVGRRALAEHPVDLGVFNLHFVEGWDWRACSGKLGIKRSDFFHVVYRVEERLGRAYSTLQPYALWPTRDYFNGVWVDSPQMVLQHSSWKCEYDEELKTYAVAA